MKKSNRIIIISTILGLFVWIVDALLDFLTFYEGNFIELLITDIPNHELYIRTLILIIFIIFGFIISRIITKLENNEEKMKSANRELAKNYQKLKKQEDELKRSEEFNKTIIENSRDCIKTLDLKGNLKFMNEGGQKLLEIEKIDNFLDKSWIDFWQDENYEKAKAAFKKAKKGETAYFEGYCPTMKGTDKWWGVKLSPMHDQDHNVEKVLAISRDITERKTSEKKLYEIEWMLEGKTEKEEEYIPQYGDLSKLNQNGLILNSVGKQQLKDIASEYLDLLETSGAIYEKNGDYALGIFSSGWCRLMDESSRKLCNTPDNEEALESGKWLCHESCWKEASLKAMKQKQPADIECNGGIRLYAVPIEVNGDIVGAINFGYGDPPLDEDKLQELSQKYKVPVKKLREKAEAYHKRPKFIIDLAKKRIRKSAQYLSYIIERKLADTRLKKYKDKLEEKVEERTKKLKETQKQLLEKQKLAILGKLAGGISHEIKNPLATIDSSALNLLYKNFEDESIEKHLKKIRKSVQKTVSIINSIRNLAKMKPAKTTKIDLKDFFQNFKEKINIPDNISFELSLPQDNIIINGDYQQIALCFENLVKNAVEAIKDTGKIEMCMKKTDAEYCQIKVSDNGIGIDEDKIDNIFEPLFSSKTTGIGFGLSLVKEIVTAHNGEIDVSSRKGVGTEFIIKLPLS